MIDCILILFIFIIYSIERSALQLDSEVTGYVETNYWNYYNFRVVTQNNVIIHVVQTGNFANQDCDVFVKGNEDPTRTSYDFANLSNLQVFNVTISEPGDTTWHVGVYGWTTCAYTLSISIPSMYQIEIDVIATSTCKQ